MTHLATSVARLVVAFAVVWVFALSGEPPVARACSCAMPATVAMSAPDDDVAVDDDNFEVDPAGDAGGLTVQAAVAGAALIAVLVFGLRAVKRQRDEGRRSKFPPIG